MGWLVRRRTPSPPAPRRPAYVHTAPQARALRAAGMRVDLGGGRGSAGELTRYRQPWQEQALDRAFTAQQGGRK